jgi:hypothetical protein
MKVNNVTACNVERVLCNRLICRPLHSALQGVAGEDNPIAAQKWIISLCDAGCAARGKRRAAGVQIKSGARRGSSRICRAPQNPKFALLFYLVAKGLLERFHFDGEMIPILCCLFGSFLSAMLFDGSRCLAVMQLTCF